MKGSGTRELEVEVEVEDIAIVLWKDSDHIATTRTPTHRADTSFEDHRMARPKNIDVPIATQRRWGPLLGFDVAIGSRSQPN
jgi:hypothetical protein